MAEHPDHPHARMLLHRQRRETEQRLAALTSSFGEIVDSSRSSNADDEHDPEGATIAFERSQVAALIAQAREHLAELDAAERRAADGSYGICEACGDLIPPERLEARPVARTCVRCTGRR
jgi:RNA polymerase-binding transcription factor